MTCGKSKFPSIFLFLVIVLYPTNVAFYWLQKCLITYLYCKMLTRRIVLPRISHASIERALRQLFLVGMVAIFRILIDCHNKNVRIERHRIFTLYDRLLVDVWFHQESWHRQSNNDKNKETPFLSHHFPWIGESVVCALFAAPKTGKNENISFALVSFTG